MKFSEQWLREWVSPEISVEELGEQLTMAGLELDGLERAAAEFSGIVVAQVNEVVPHPDADKLRVCTVNAGEGEDLQIVCGAANVRPGLKVPAALIGAKLPGDFKIKKSKLRGVQSFGMLCSESEMGLAETSEGLMELADDAPIGADIREYLGLDDTIIEIDLTPNRGDCAGIAGIAREVGVLNRLPVTEPEINPVAVTIEEARNVVVSDTAACPRYLGRIIKGVNAAAATPLWMVEKLRRSGIRSNGPLVDVTNYVLMELGQPMHAFDLARIDGDIQVRMAGKGEKLTLLDGKELDLGSDTLMICDSSKPLALAGIMGGIDSGIEDNTTDIFLECAYFAPLAIAGKARHYGLQTDSSFRFERGVDYELQHKAIERASSLIMEICGGQAGPVTEAVSEADLPQRSAILLRTERIRRLLGANIVDHNVEEMLFRLGMKVEKVKDGWNVIAPSFRFDMAIEADLIEDIGRIHGYNNLPRRSMQAAMRAADKPEDVVAPNRIRNALVNRGFQEVITYSFIDPAEQSLFEPNQPAKALANPISSEMAVMRTSLIPGLARTVVYNQNRQQPRVRIFESGLSFVMQGDELIQNNKLAAAISGDVLEQQWGDQDRPVDFYDLKADLEVLLGMTGDVDQFDFVADRHPALHPGQSARIDKNGECVGWIGSLHPEIIKKQGLNGSVIVFEIDMAAIESGSLPVFLPLSRFPSIRRDLSVLVAESVSWQQISDCIRDENAEILQEVNIFDIYRGKGVDSGQKSVSLGLILQDFSRTLTDEDVDGFMESVINKLKNKLNATLRD